MQLHKLKLHESQAWTNAGFNNCVKRFFCDTCTFKNLFTFLKSFLPCRFENPSLVVLPKNKNKFLAQSRKIAKQTQGFGRDAFCYRFLDCQHFLAYDGRGLLDDVFQRQTGQRVVVSLSDLFDALRQLTPAGNNAVTIGAG